MTSSMVMAGGPFAGDWICVSCDASVFASKHNCYKCQKPRPSGTGGGGVGVGGATVRYRAHRPPQHEQSNDSICAPLCLTVSDGVA